MHEIEQECSVHRERDNCSDRITMKSTIPA